MTPMSALTFVHELIDSIILSDIYVPHESLLDTLTRVHGREILSNQSSRKDNILSKRK
jgi:hypothetical protein